MSFRYDNNENDDDLVFLPPSTSMRGMWLDWARERGWDPVQTCKNRRKFRKKEGWKTSPIFYKTQTEADAAGPTTLHDDMLMIWAD